MFHDLTPQPTADGSNLNTMNMKKILYILTAAICLLTSCGEKELKFPEKLYGDWFCHSTSLTSTDVYVYVTFNADSFQLFQKIGDGAYRVYQGTYSLTLGADGSYILSGKYNDGTPWGAEYVLLSSSNDVIIFTAGDVTETYTRVSGGIPEDVRNSASSATKSAGCDEVRFL